MSATFAKSNTFPNISSPERCLSSGFFAGMDLGMKHRATVVTWKGDFLFTAGRHSKKDSQIIADILNFLLRHKILAVAIGDCEDRLYFPLDQLRRALRSAGIFPVLASEFQTSKRCPLCRKYSPKIIGRNFVCERCDLFVDRDIVGAMNIYVNGFGERCPMPNF